MILSRQEFIDHFNTLKSGLGDQHSPLWCPEEDTYPCMPSNWFVCVKPLGVSRFKFSYWHWCNKTLQGKVRCYSSDTDNHQEWWGFTEQKDILLWTLKWT